MRKHANFRPAWWLRNRHAQTVWRTMCQPTQGIPLHRERLWLTDGDFLDLDWTPEQAGPLALVLHGLEGGSCSPYARSMLQALHAAGFQTVFMHFRGCSG